MADCTTWWRWCKAVSRGGLVTIDGLVHNFLQTTLSGLIWSKIGPVRRSVVFGLDHGNTSYSHIVKHGLKTPTHDPGNTHMMKSCAPPVLQVSRVTTCDPGKQESRVTTHDPGKPGDLPRDWSSTRPRDVTRFRCTTCPLIGTWKTMGQSTVDRRINKVTRLTIVTHAQSAVNAA